MSDRALNPAQTQDYFYTNVAHFTPFSARIGKTIVDVTGSVYKNVPQDRLYTLPVQVLATITLKTGIAICIPIALIETIVTLPIGHLAIVLGKRYEVKSEFYQKYAMKCVAYGNNSAWEILPLFLFLICPPIFLRHRAFPIHIVNSIAHSLIFSLCSLSSTSYFTKKENGILDERLNELFRQKGNDLSSRAVKEVIKLTKSLHLSEEAAKTEIDRALRELHLDTSRCLRELLPLVKNDAEQIILGSNFVIDSRIKAYVKEYLRNRIRPVEHQNQDFDNSVDIIYSALKQLVLHEELTVKLANLQVRDIIGFKAELLKCANDARVEQIEKDLRFISDIAGQNGADVLSDLGRAIKRDLYTFDLTVPVNFTDRYRDEIRFVGENSFSQAGFQRGLRLAIAFFGELGLITETSPGSKAYTIKDNYKTHYYDLIKSALVEIYQNDHLVKHLGKNGDIADGRDNIKSNFNIAIQIARYMRFKEIESPKGILCPETDPAYAQLLEAKALLTELEKIPGEKAKLIQKILDADSITVSADTQSLADKIGALAANVHQGNSMEIFVLYPFAQNIRESYKMETLFLRAFDDALIQLKVAENPQPAQAAARS